MLSMLRKAIITLNVLSSISCIALAVKFIGMPIVAQSLFKEDYKKLVFQCDNVMQSHLLAKNKALANPSDDSNRELKAAELGLLDCHDYDKLRKKLISWGLTQNDLSSIGIEAIEGKAEDVRSFVRTHEIKY